MSSFGPSNYDITFDRINVELIPYVQALIGMTLNTQSSFEVSFQRKTMRYVFLASLVIRYHPRLGIISTHLFEFLRDTSICVSKKKNICIGTWFKTCFICSNIKPGDERISN